MYDMEFGWRGGFMCDIVYSVVVWCGDMRCGVV